MQAFCDGQFLDWYTFLEKKKSYYIFMIVQGSKLHIAWGK